ncbi:MAG: hypothetical protein J6P20_07225, partial [Oscillospiraceae bacterium]|nr:hypothetical protein [Oscillospiraceae bacterium]
MLTVHEPAKGAQSLCHEAMSPFSAAMRKDFERNAAVLTPSCLSGRLTADIAAGIIMSGSEIMKSESMAAAQTVSKR